MKIPHNNMAMNAYREYIQKAGAGGKQPEQLSTGARINRADDDALANAYAEKLRSKLVGGRVSQQAAEDALSLVQTAEGSLTEVQSMLCRLMDLAEQRTDHACGGDMDPGAMQKEAALLLSEIDRIAEGCSFHGDKLLDASGGKDSLTLYIGDVFGEPNRLTYTIHDMHTASLGIDAVDLSTEEGGALARGAIKAAMDKVSDVRGELGALQNRLEHDVPNLGMPTRDLGDNEDRREAYMEENNWTNAAREMLKQANQQSQDVLRLKY